MKVREIMSKLFNKPAVYVSHPIRGTNGDMEGNCRKALIVMRKLRRLFPEIKWYVPAESDIILQVLCKAKRISESDILWGDLKILRDCNGWVFFKWDKSRGGEIEREEAARCGIVYDGSIIVDDASRMHYTTLRRRMLPIVEETIAHYRRGK